MKLAITAHGATRESAVDSRFGRAEYFIVFDLDTNTWESKSNTQNLEAAHGAGIQAAQHILECGVSAVITGHVGPKAFKVLAAGKVDMYSVGTAIDTVEAALTAFKMGTLTKVIVPNGLEPQK